MASLFLIASLTKDVADGLRAWRTRDHVPLTDHQILERTRNIVTVLLGSYLIVALPDDAETQPRLQIERASPEREFRHMHGCACGSCPMVSQ